MATRRQKPEKVRALDMRITDQLAELELRIRRLEARLRAVSASVPAKAQKRRPPKERPRCPHCYIELPRGRRRETCEWCGFVLSAAEEKTSAQKRASRR